MKYLVMCEGNNELQIMNILLDNQLLKFTKDDLVDLKIHWARQLKYLELNLLLLNQPVTILRIGDKMTDKLKIPSSVAHIVTKENIYKFCTLPEFEILLIINEGLYEKYKKIGKKPKTFAKDNIVYNGIRYDQTFEFINKYYGERPDLLVDNIRKYKQKNKNHAKNEYYIADLLK